MRWESLCTRRKGDKTMEILGISAILSLLIGLVIESRVQIAYIKGKLEVLERKIDGYDKRRDKYAN